MDNAHKPTFSVVIWIILGGIYIFSLWWFGVTVGNGIQIFLDIVAFFLGISLWKFFFSQFILPVLTLENRKKIAQRLRTGSDGPALFIENGYIVEIFKQGQAGIDCFKQGSNSAIKEISQIDVATT